MSRIDKLSISGVRSFSPAAREAIQFNTPLTLIVGYNGSGKTTIIECLKYATTGEQPPNTKGGAFIHDPKLCGEKEVMAQVKLQFRSINDRQHVATRSLLLTASQTSMKQKSLDCSLVVVNNGERTTTSTKMAQIDEMIPERLGVSPAILDAVIFCHQDESLWPLSEPHALKKRFDEIFEALKYTRVLDNIKAMRKQQLELLATLQNDEAHNKVNKDRGERAEKRMSGLQAEIEAARQKCEALTAQMHETQDKIRDKRQQANSYLQIFQNLTNKREQLAYRREAADELRQTLDELPEDDAALERSLAQYEESMGRYQEELERNRTHYRETQQDLAQHRSRLATCMAEQGKHQSDREKYERQIRARAELVQGAAKTYGFRGFDEELTDRQIQAFTERIQRLLADKKRDLEQIQQENAAELDKETSAITELEGRRAARTQDRVSAKQRMGAIEKRIGILQNEASLIDVDEGAKAILDGQFKDLDARMERAHDAFETAKWDEQLSQSNGKQWQLESENEKLSHELVECSRLASERAQLDYRKKEVSDRQLKLDTLTRTWKERLTSVLENNWQPRTLESQFQSAQNRQSNIVVEAQRLRGQTRQEQQRVEYRLKSKRESLKGQSIEMQQCKDQVLDALRGVEDDLRIEEFEAVVKKLEKDVEDLRTQAGLFDALLDYYNQCKETLVTKKKCLLCDRHFDDGQKAALEKLSKKIEKRLHPDGKAETEDDLEQTNVRLASLHNARPLYDTYERLRAELPGLEGECQELSKQYEELERQLEEQDSRLSAEEEKQRALEDLSKTVTSITQTLKDIQDAEAQVDRIVSQQLSGVALRSAEEIQELQADVSEQLRSLKTKISQLTTDRQRMKDQMTSLELEKSELRNKISHASGQLEKRKDLQVQVQTLKDDQANQKATIQRADEELEKIEPSIREARYVRDDTLSRGRGREQAVADQRDAIANSISEIKMMDSEIQDYVDRGGPSSLSSNQRSIATLQQSMAAAEKELADLTVQTNKLVQDSDSGDRKKKNIADNISYRKHLRTLETLRAEIAGLEDRNADEDYERLQGEARSLENHANRLLAERGSVMGTMKSKDEELGRLLQEWELDYKDAKLRYRESHIRVETTRAAIEDLLQCGGAVEKAVMQFHAMKMAEVNRIAAELWHATYQGTDIDTIVIRSSAESTTGRRSYNYRLRMVKQDAEMDMRGRCSAGQKVLASIVIRLALAESFGVNCGLIALDEPTTNLDRDNIRSLAESLHRIIRARQQQSNFQLIVITHDEEFLRHMRCSDFCDSFFRVKRDEKQHSVIVRESITKIF